MADKPFENPSPSMTAGVPDVAPITDLRIIGSSGLRIFSAPQGSGGFLYEEILDKLRFRLQNITIYREMNDNSSVINTIMYIIQALIRQADWKIKPSIESEAGIEAADFMTSVLGDFDDMTLDDFLIEALSFLVYGYALFEIVLKIRKGLHPDDLTINSKFDDGKYGIRGLYPRSVDITYQWVLNEDRKLVGVRQRDPYASKFFYLPMERVVHFKNGALKQSPEGRSLLRGAVIDWYSLKKIEELEKIALERDLAGLPVLEVPLDLLRNDARAIDKTLRADLEKMLADLKNDERAFLLLPTELDTQGQPTGYKFRLVSASGSKNMDISAAKAYYKRNILESVLAQFITLGTQAVGSFALSENHSNLFSSALGAIMDSMASTFNRQVIDRLCKLNKVPNELVPTLCHSDIVTPDLAQVGAYVQALASSGVLPVGDPALISKLLTLAELPVPEDVANLTADPND